VYSTYLILKPLKFTRIQQIPLKRRYPASTASRLTVAVALAQAVSRCRLTAEARVRSPWQWDRFLSLYFSFPLSVSHHQCSTLINSSPTDAIFLFTMSQQPPSAPRPPHYRGFTITLRRTTFRRTPLDEWSARRGDLYLTTHNMTDIHAPGGIRTHNPSKRAAADSRLRPSGHRDQHQRYILLVTESVFT